MPSEFLYYFLYAFGFLGIVLLISWRTLPFLITSRSSDYPKVQAENDIQNIIWTLARELNIHQRVTRQEVSLLEATTGPIYLPIGIYFDIPRIFQSELVMRLNDALRPIGRLKVYATEDVSLYKLYYYNCLSLNVFLRFSDK